MRLAKVKKQAQKPEPQPKKPSIRISDTFAGRIVELALQNPELGAGRLVAVLEKERIDLSASSVQRILKRSGLETRKKRMAEIESRGKKTRKRRPAPEKTRRPKSAPKKPATPIGDDAAERILAISLQNPDFGASRLVPLLEKERIFASASAVYRILKRHGLENRPKRLLRLEDQVPPEISPELEAELPEPFIEPADTEPPEPEAEIPEPIPEVVEIRPILIADEAPEPAFKLAAAVPIPPGIETPEPSEKPEPVPVEPVQPERPPVRKTRIMPLKKRSHWVFYPLYLLLLLLIGYLGFNALQTIQYARLETEALPSDNSVPVGVAAKAGDSAQSLDGYRQIWERNLFNTGKAGGPDSAQKISLEKIAPAKKDLGLELMGTVVSDDPRLSRAIIDNRSIKKQEAYREGDKAGKVKIKKILRNNVVITTAEGDELLTVEIKESGRIAPAALSERLGSQSAAAPQAPGSRQAPARTLSLNLKREEVAAAFTDMDGFMKELRIVPYNPGDQPSGFMISRITAQNVLRKMGLRSRDVITAINDQAVTGPEQAAGFFERLSQGGEVTINFQRRRRNRQIKLNIE
jgi:general secretion pathway protein C